MLRTPSSFASELCCFAQDDTGVGSTGSVLHFSSLMRTQVLFPTTLLRGVLLADVREAAFQFGREVCFLSGNMDWFPRFTPQPTIQFSGRCGDEAALALERHPFVRPTLSDGHGLSEKGGDLLPSFQLSVRLRGIGLRLGSLLCTSFGHGLSMHDLRTDFVGIVSRILAAWTRRKSTPQN